MSFWRYQMLRMAVGFGLFVVSVLPTAYLMGGLASLMPPAARGAAFGLVGIAWLLGMLIATHIVTEKLSKRWSH